MAPRTFWISSPTAGVWCSLQIPRDTATLFFKNDGPYDYFLSYGGTSHPPYTPPNDSRIMAQVFAGEYAVLPIQSRGTAPRELALNAIGDFDGYVWYYAVDNTGGLALSGSASSRNLLALVTYGPFDAAPVAGSVRPLWHDLSSQPRVIAIPPATVNAFVGQASYTAALQIATPFPSFLGSLVSTSGSFVVPIYLYSLHVSASQSSVLFAVQAIGRNDSGTILDTITIFRGNTVTGNVSFTPAFPFVCRYVPSAGVVDISIQIQALAIGANPSKFEYNITAECDTETGMTIPAIGGGLLGNIGSGGVLF